MRRGWKRLGSGGLPLMVVTISAAISRSLLLRCCEARRSRSKAASASQRCWAIRIPMARSMTVREVKGPGERAHGKRVVAPIPDRRRLVCPPGRGRR